MLEGGDDRNKKLGRGEVFPCPSRSELVPFYLGVWGSYPFSQAEVHFVEPKGRRLRPAGMNLA